MLIAELVTKYLTASDEDERTKMEDKLKDELIALKNLVNDIKKYKYV